MKQIKLFGERNTGTNYLRALMEANIDAPLIAGSVPDKKGLMRNPLLFDLRTISDTVGTMDGNMRSLIPTA